MITITEETYAKIKRLATGEAFSNESWGGPITPEVKERIEYAREIVEEIEKGKDWILHDGKCMPITGDTLVLLQFRDKHIEKESSFAGYWHKSPKISSWVWADESKQSYKDIIAYKVVTE